MRFGGRSEPHGLRERLGPVDMPWPVHLQLERARIGEGVFLLAEAATSLGPFGPALPLGTQRVLLPHLCPLLACQEGAHLTLRGVEGESILGIDIVDLLETPLTCCVPPA